MLNLLINFSNDLKTFKFSSSTSLLTSCNKMLGHLWSCQQIVKPHKEIVIPLNRSRGSIQVQSNLIDTIQVRIIRVEPEQNPFTDCVK